jgi:hypothetical protein
MTTENYRDFFGPAGHASYDEVMTQMLSRKCECGGSHGRDGLHLISWHDEHGWDEAERRADE